MNCARKFWLGSGESIQVSPRNNITGMRLVTNQTSATDFTRNRLPRPREPSTASSQRAADFLQYPAQPGDRAHLVTPGERMLPDPDDAPAALLQSPAHRPITLLITEDLHAPELGILLRPRRVRRTPMPETAIDE